MLGVDDHDLATLQQAQADIPSLTIVAPAVFKLQRRPCMAGEEPLTETASRVGLVKERREPRKASATPRLTPARMPPCSQEDLPRVLEQQEQLLLAQR